jgi:MFS family permease
MFIPIFFEVLVYLSVRHVAFSFGAAFAPNAASLLIFRFFVGFFGSAPMNNVPASIGDYTVPMNRGLYSIVCMSCLNFVIISLSSLSAKDAIAAFGGPSLGPLISAFIQHDAGWR